ncbi:MAG: hypothetical protein ACHQHN_11825 [Sphingobacteriales bacterium]
MNKKLVMVITFILAGFLKSQAQSYFSASPYDFSTYGTGANNVFGWGENFNRTIDTRPNTPAGYGVMMINYHTGLTLSAHSGYGGIRFYNQGYPNPYDPSTGAVMVMSIVNGNVGVGTTTPAKKLTVALGGTDRIWAQGGGDGDGAGNFQSSDAGGTNIWTFGRDNKTTGNFVLFNGSSQRLTVDVSGNVGIGTTNPGSYMLAVNGNVHARQVNVDITGWGDYVFKSNYVLPPLSQIKTYVAQYQHLPEMPSERQITQEGLNLGEMNKVLVKKVEELTLYLIRQQEEIKELQIKVRRLSKNKHSTR